MLTGNWRRYKRHLIVRSLPEGDLPATVSLEFTGSFLGQRLDTPQDVWFLDITPWMHDIQKKHLRIGYARNPVHSKQYINFSSG